MPNRPLVLSPVDASFFGSFITILFRKFRIRFVCAEEAAHYSLIACVAWSNTSVLIQSSTEMCYPLQQTY